jgi:ATP-dependent Lhr-like helicase
VLAGLRSDAIGRVASGPIVISGTDDELRWWTWAGYRVNATLQASLSGLAADPSARVSDLYVRLRPDLRVTTWPSLVKALTGRLMMPLVDEKALEGLKFSEALPRHLAEATLATRLADLDRAAEVLTEPVQFERAQ